MTELTEKSEAGEQLDLRLQRLNSDHQQRLDAIRRQELFSYWLIFGVSIVAACLPAVPLLLAWYQSCK